MVLCTLVGSETYSILLLFGMLGSHVHSIVPQWVLYVVLYNYNIILIIDNAHPSGLGAAVTVCKSISALTSSVVCSINCYINIWMMCIV